MFKKLLRLQAVALVTVQCHPGSSLEVCLCTEAQLGVRLQHPEN